MERPATLIGAVECVNCHGHGQSTLDQEDWIRALRIGYLLTKLNIRLMQAKYGDNQDGAAASRAVCDVQGHLLALLGKETNFTQHIISAVVER